MSHIGPNIQGGKVESYPSIRCMQTCSTPLSTDQQSQEQRTIIAIDLLLHRCTT
ncbi:hypothetical protein DACRYDRAFT_22776, partial [Dacryopinax primogenitus]